VGILIIIVAIVYLLLAVGGAIWLGNRGLGDGWGTGWTGWLTLPFAAGAVFAALMLVVFGLMLFFLAKIDDNLAEAERRRQQAVMRPRVQPSVAETRVATANLPAVSATEASGAAAVVVGTAAIATATAEPEAEVIALPGGVEDTAPEAVATSAVAVEEAEADAPWEEPVAAPDAPEVVGPEAPAAFEASSPSVEGALVAGAAAATILPRIEMEEPAEDLPAVAAIKVDETGVALPEAERAVEVVDVVELEVEAPPVLEVSEAGILSSEARVEEGRETHLPEALLAAAAVHAVHEQRSAEDEIPEIDVPRVEVPGLVTGAAVVDASDELSGVDMPEAVAPDAALETPLPELPTASFDDLNVPPVLPDEVELPRVDVAAPETELETEEMSDRGISLAGAALAAGAVAAAIPEQEPEPQPETVAIDTAATRLPEIEITEVEPASAAVEADATLAAATGVPESETAPAPAPDAVTPQPNEVAELKAEVASLKEMIAQLAAQLRPAASAAAVGGAAAGAAVAAAAAGEPEAPARAQEPSETAAAVEPSAKLPGADEVARIAAEVNAAAPRRPRTVAKPPAPPPASEPATPEARAPEPATELVAPVIPPGEDDLEAIAGLGPIYAKRLRELGVTTYAQLADAPYDVLHKVTRGNLERVIKEDWRGQARRLSKKD
jgi:predicted flap endonuclease-1-like 5' DNA nuclease